MYRFAYLIPILFFLSAACKNNIDTVNAVTAKNTFPDKTGKDVELIFSDSAKLKIKLISPWLEYYTRDTSYVIFPKGVHVLFYDDSAKIKTELTAKYGIRYEGIGRMEAKNDVTLVNEKGERLNTEHLIWDEQKQLIYTEAFVKIKTANEIIYGNGLESNQDFTRYKIKNIKGTLALSEDEHNKK
ncbi:MAG: LPS export ABC transporter periplasmic protein LptC [Bacteroidia bacterium]|nr:LPS export ABC transporter periplasmic protein LptC [Bacteroidia bacterium]